MKFDWSRFLSQHRIPYVTSGSNVSVGKSIAIRCPWCGDNDPSEHLGISLNGSGWGCLRNASHRGKSPARLICQLLHCSPAEAAELLGKSTAVAVTQSELSQSADRLKRQITPPTLALTLPSEFKPLTNGSIRSRPFISYLHARGYRDGQIKWLTDQYNLHYATNGDFAGRLVLPIYGRYGELLSWTARAISERSTPRYKTLRMSGEPPLAKLASNHTLLGLPVLWSATNPRAVVLVEGPFDALKISAYGYPWGIYGAALFGLNVYPSQVAEIVALRRIYPDVYLLLDEDAELQRLRLLNALRPAQVRPLKMPKGADDPGAMTAAEITQLSLELSA